MSDKDIPIALPKMPRIFLTAWLGGMLTHHCRLTPKQPAGGAGTQTAVKTDPHSLVSPNLIPAALGLCTMWSTPLRAIRRENSCTVMALCTKTIFHECKGNAHTARTNQKLRGNKACATCRKAKRNSSECNWGAAIVKTSYGLNAEHIWCKNIGAQEIIRELSWTLIF